MGRAIPATPSLPDNPLLVQIRESKLASTALSGGAAAGQLPHPVHCPYSSLRLLGLDFGVFRLLAFDYQ